MNKETKHWLVPGCTKILDGDQGIVEHLIAVYGNIDLGNDVIHQGAARKTIMERGLQIKVLDGHNSGSVTDVVGKPIELREVTRDELPIEVMREYPDATGGIMATTQYLLDTERGREVFKRIKSGAVDQYSIGYDPIIVDFEHIGEGENKRSIRNLREIRLWEYSPVIWGMNPATRTVNVKGKKVEQKPYTIVESYGDEFCVYRADEDGGAIGESLGCHATREDAQAQIAALYANVEDADKSASTEDVAEPCPECQKAGRVIAKRNLDRLKNILAELQNILDDAGYEEDADDKEDADDRETPAASEGKDDSIPHEDVAIDEGGAKSPTKALTPRDIEELEELEQLFVVVK